MKPTLVLTLAVWLAAPSISQAQSMNPGAGPFYDGLAHLFVSPTDLIPVIALALLAGLRGPQSGRAVLFVLPVAWLLGSFAGQWLAASQSLSPITAAVTFALGALVAADIAFPLALIVACAIAIGLLYGGLNGAAIVGQYSTGLRSAGVAMAIFVVVSLLAGQVTTIRAEWARIVLRVAGSWIAAIGMFMFGWSMRA
jgi:urease accessory protein